MTGLETFIGTVSSPAEDWTFANADTKVGLHGLHPYPARMIPQIARKLIERYSERGSNILDPFCGSGTVLLESRILGRNSVGVDLNPLAVLLAKAKSTPIAPRALVEQYDSLTRKIAQDEKTRKAGKLTIEAPALNDNLEFWFKDYVISDLALIRQRVFEIEHPDVKDFFLACFSLTVRMVSNTRGNEFKLYRLPKEKLGRFHPDVFKIFRENLHEGIRRMETTYLEMSKNVRSKVTLQDTRQLALEDRVDLVVTSPPYGDSRTTVAYGQFSRYPALWCGLGEGWHPEVTKQTILKVDQSSLGGNGKTVDIPDSKTLHEALRKIAKKSVDRTHDTALFFQDVKKSFDSIREIMGTGAHFCIVIGNRAVSRVRVPTDKILVELGELCGFSHITTYYRKIPTKRMPWENAPENITGEKGKTIHEESIVVLRR